MNVSFEQERFRSKQANKKRRLYVHTIIIFVMAAIIVTFFLLLRSELYHNTKPDPTLIALLGTMIGYIGNSFVSGIKEVYTMGAEETKQDSDNGTTPYTNGNPDIPPQLPSLEPDQNRGPCPDTASSQLPTKTHFADWDDVRRSTPVDNSWMSSGNSQDYNNAPPKHTKY